jgi:hypothetical protein
MESEFACDVAYIGEEPVLAHDLFQEQIARIESESLAWLLREGYEYLKAIYEEGSFIAHPAALLASMRQTSVRCGIVLGGNTATAVLRFFDRLNRALFAQQTLDWLLHTDFAVRLHGAAWRRHPRLRALSAPEEASIPTCTAAGGYARIQLAIGPYGTVSPRVLDGVAGGIFYLFRFCPADVIERLYPPIQRFCLSRQIGSNIELRTAMTPAIARLVHFADRTLGVDVLTDWADFVPQVLAWGSATHARSAAAIWSAYPTLTFSTRAELIALCEKYLYDVPARTRIARSMRQEMEDRQPQVQLTLPLNANSMAAAA